MVDISCNYFVFQLLTAKLLEQWAIGRLHFLTQTFAESFAESKLRSKYLLKSKSEVISLSENMANNMDSLVN